MQGRLLGGVGGRGGYGSDGGRGRLGMGVAESCEDV